MPRFRVGDRVQTRGHVGGYADNYPDGIEFTVTEVQTSTFHNSRTGDTTWYAGDPGNRGVWESYLVAAPIRLELSYAPTARTVSHYTISDAFLERLGTIGESFWSHPAGIATEVSTEKKEDTGKMSIASVSRELAQYYVENKLEADFGSVLTDAAYGASVGKEARKLVRDFKAWLNTMTIIERAGLSGRMIQPVKVGSKFTFEFRAFDGFFIGASLAPATMTASQAMKLIEDELPTWVRLSRINGQIRWNVTRDVDFYRRALEIATGYYSGYGLMRVGTDGKVSTADVMWWRKQAMTFSAKATQHLRDAMREFRKSDAVVGKAFRSGTGNFDEFRQQRAKLIKTDEEIIQRFPVQAHGLLSSRNWGIEVEAAGARGATAPAGWSAKGDGSLESAYPDQSSDNLDHEVSGADTSGDYEDYDYCSAHDTYHPYNSDTREFVSPILHSYHSRGLEELTKYLLTQPQNDTAGVHVHVDVADLSARQIGGLVYGYNVIEPLLEASYRRTRRDYCQTRETGELVSIGQTAKSAAKDMRSGAYKRLDYGRNRDNLGDKAYLDAGDRYVSLNLQSIGSHGTVEFRAMGNVYEYEYLVRWAYIVREFVNTAKNGAKPADYNRVKDFASLQKLFARFGSETIDNSMSTITKADMDMIADRQSKDVFNLSPQRELVAAVGGEV